MSVELVHSSGNQISQPVRESAAATEISSRRSMAEVQAMAYMAKQFPRNQQSALERIKVACQRPKLANHALYQYSKGGTSINGVSIRVAEVLAREWGNVQYGFVELERTSSTVTAQAYCWDMETNTRAERTVTINLGQLYGNQKNQQERERAIAELVANQMQRRVRVCILAIIPSDVVETAEEECIKAQKANLNWNGRDGEATKRADISNMLAKFEEVGVTKKQIENRFQRNIEAIEPAQFLSLRNIYASIRDGLSSADSYFPPDKEGEDKPQSAVEKAVSKIKEKTAKVKTDEKELSVFNAKMKEIEKWAQDGCEERDDYLMAIQQLQAFVKDGKLNPDWLEDAKAVVKSVASKNGVKI